MYADTAVIALYIKNIQHACRHCDESARAGLSRCVCFVILNAPSLQRTQCHTRKCPEAPFGNKLGQGRVAAGKSQRAVQRKGFLRSHSLSKNKMMQLLTVERWRMKHMTQIGMLERNTTNWWTATALQSEYSMYYPVETELYWFSLHHYSSGVLLFRIVEVAVSCSATRCHYIIVNQSMVFNSKVLPTFRTVYHTHATLGVHVCTSSIINFREFNLEVCDDGVSTLLKVVVLSWLPHMDNWVSLCRTM